MNIDKITNYIESSFLSSLLMDKEVTDISYNGENFFYLHNYKGRKRIQFPIKNEEIRDFVRQIANLSEKKFSYTDPILDISFDKYRFNAVHHSVATSHNVATVTFSLRISSDELHITKSNKEFFNEEVVEFIDLLLENHQSIVIGGLTGTGKTEFQKYLITRMKENDRVIVIDNVLELDNLSETDSVDINIWQADDKKDLSSSIQTLVRNALRSNPDWIIVAESRGAEMIEVLNSAMTGHPIITTLHALDAESIPNRMARMVLMNGQKMVFEDVKHDLLHHLSIYFYLKREIDKNNTVHRYIDSIVECDEEGNMNVLYNREDWKPGLLERLSPKLKKRLKLISKEVHDEE